MKIALVTQPNDVVAATADLSTSIGIINYHLARHLRKQHQVIIYSKLAPGLKEVETDTEGIEYRRISTSWGDRFMRPLRLAERLGLIWSPKRPLFSSRLYYWDYATAVARDIKRSGCDIAHVANYAQFLPIIKHYCPDMTLSLHMNCEWLSQLDPALVAPRITLADHIFGCSEYIVAQIKERYPEVADKTRVIFNGVDTEQFQPRQKDRKKALIEKPDRILFVARISPEKGVHVLLAAFRQVVAQYPDAHLDIVGPAHSVPYEFVIGVSDDELVRRLAEFYPSRQRLRGGNVDYLHFLEAQIDETMAKKITFHGYQPHSQLKELYHRSAIFVFPSVWDEPFGMPIIEAMASGIPVVATRGGGITELIEDGKSGRLVERGNASELADVLLHLLQNPAERCRLGHQANLRSRQTFAWDRITQQLLAHYQ